MQMNKQKVFAAILVEFALAVVLYYIIHTCDGMGIPSGGYRPRSHSQL